MNLDSHRRKEENLSTIKMNKNEEKAVGKANETSAADLFDVPLMHVLTVLLGMQLDGRHVRARDILCANDIRTWREFRNETTNELLKAEYEDDSDNIVRFNKFDRKRFRLIKEFKKYLRANQHIEADLHDPCTWTIQIWDD